jgi:signal transduction histidine kinase/ActR/RegA family two-component response regulator
VSKNGREFLLEVRKAPIINEMHEIYGTVGIAIDITRQKHLQLQLEETQKMKAIGTLAAGIAHDFNNLMMGVQGRVSLMAIEDKLPQSLHDHLKAVEEYVRSATNLTNQLLGLARGGKYEVKPFDLNDVVISSASMFGRTHKNITVHKNTTNTSLVIEADQRQIEQVLLNLLVNAWQAMPSGGQIFLETKIVDLDEDFCKPYQVMSGNYAKVSIADTGTGMDEIVRQQIFDPFFTTKGKGRNTGLGLSSAYTIIKNHGGMITVESEVGKGSTFCIYLPQSEKRVNQVVSEESLIHIGSETVLLVDDEDLIIDVGGAMLEKLGYRVVIANDCEQAVDAVMVKGDEIDLVILDMVMPGMNGEVTFDRIREVKPDLPVILSSGYAIDDRTRAILRKGCNGFIQKPFNLKTLSNKIRHVLEEAGKPSKP